MSQPTEQTQEFDDFGLNSSDDKKRVLRRVMTLLTVLLMTSVSLNMYLIKRVETRSNEAITREENHSKENTKLQNEYAIAFREQADKFNAVIYEILKRQMNTNLKVDTTLSKK